jgi:hypothetical protein
MVSPTDYDTIASRYAARIDERPWNALYERPTTLALLPHVGGKDVLDAGCALVGTQIGSSAKGRASWPLIPAAAWWGWQTGDWAGGHAC